jgi:hypothetical protein
VNQVRPFGKKICITSTFTYTEILAAFTSSVSMNDSGARITSFKSTRMTAIKDNVSGGITEITHLVQGDVWSKSQVTDVLRLGSIDNLSRV